MILTTDEVYEFVLAKEKGKPEPTVFLIKEMSCGVSNIISNEATTRDKFGNIKVLLGEASKLLILNCLVGWRNLKNKKGEEVSFSIENIMKLPGFVQTEINNEINRISTPTDEERKN